MRTTSKLAIAVVLALCLVPMSEAQPAAAAKQTVAVKAGACGATHSPSAEKQVQLRTDRELMALSRMWAAASDDCPSGCNCSSDNGCTFMSCVDSSGHHYCEECCSDNCNRVECK